MKRSPIIWIRKLRSIWIPSRVPDHLVNEELLPISLFTTMTNSNIPVMNSFCSYIFRKFIFDWFFHHCDFVLQGTSYDTKDKRTERSKSWSKGKAKDQDFVPQSSSHDTKDKRTERSQTWCKAKDQDEDVSRTVSYKGSPCKVEFDPLMGMRVLSKMILLIMFKFFQACTKK